MHDLELAHDHDDFESFVVRLGPVADRDAFFARLGAVIRRYDILRLKGFLDQPGSGRRLVVQAVGDRLQQYFDRPWREGEARARRGSS